MADPSRPPVLIAGGGTMGHVTPGLALATELENRGWDRTELHLVGSRRGVEVEVVPSAGFVLHTLAGRGIQRRLTLENLGALLQLARGFLQAVALVRRLRPALVVATGGYASVGCVLAAASMRVPILVAEQNAVPGLANRLASRLARATASSFEGTGLPNEQVTGNPVRAPILEVAGRDRTRVRSELGVGDTERLLLVFGGSLGARRLNRQVIEAVAGGRTSGWRIRHIIGQRDWDLFAEQRRQLAGPRYEAVAYEQDMARWLAAADLALCRAGASTVAELAVVGTPAILVPLPGAPGDHQSANARALADAGAAWLVADDELNGARLAELLGRSDPATLSTMAAAARACGRPDAAARLADLVEENLSDG